MRDINHYKNTKLFFSASAREKKGFYDAKSTGPFKHNPWQRKIRKIVINKLDKLFALDQNLKTLIDAGCGIGDFCLELKRRFPGLTEVWGSDFSEETLVIAKKNVNSDKNIFIKQADLLDMPFIDNNFDLTLCINTLHHIHQDDLSEAISELARISKKYIIIEIKNENNFYKKYLRRQPCESITVFPTKVKKINFLFKKNNSQLIYQQNIFFLEFLSPLVVLVYKKN